MLVTTHFLESLLASKTTQIADLSGLYFNSSISDCSNIDSKRSGTHCHVTPDIQITGVSQPQSSGVNPFETKSFFI